MKILIIISIMFFGVSSTYTFAANNTKKKIENEKKINNDFVASKLKLTDRQKGQIKSVNKYFEAQEVSLKNDLTLLLEERKKKELQLKIEHRTSFFALLNEKQRSKASTIFRNSDLYVNEKLLVEIVKDRASMFATQPKANNVISKETEKQLADLRQEYIRLKLIVDLKKMTSSQKVLAVNKLRKNFQDDRSKIISMNGKVKLKELNAYWLAHNNSQKSEYEYFVD